MSAIFGLLNTDGKPVDRSDLERMQAVLAHHGAEGGGVWLEGAVGLGQRLMRFTPQDLLERQPLKSGDAQLVLVADARLDDRAERRDPSAADSELILQAYKAWGPACVLRLTGVFAFAIWDGRAQTLFAARSPIMAPSLVYVESPTFFAFATMPSGLQALPFVPREIDEAELANHLTGIDVTSTATLFRGIKRLPTGYWLVANREGVKTECYWRPDLACELHLGRDEDYLAAFNELLTRIVGDHLISLTPVGLQMSGGLDSSAVAAVAARILAARGERLTAFTEVPRDGFTSRYPSGGYADETPFVQAIAGMYPNLGLNLVHTDGRIFLAGLDAMFAHLEGPLLNASNRVWIESILGEASRRGLNVLLDGMQGNITMSWPGIDPLAGLLRVGHWRQAADHLRALAGANGTMSAVRALVGQCLMPLLPDAAWLAVHGLRHPEARAPEPWLSQSPINPAFAMAQNLPARARAGRYAFRRRSNPDTCQLRYEALASQDMGAYLSAYRAMYRVDMRSPTADVRLAEFCLSLPLDQYRRDDETRSLVRRAMAGRLPPEVLQNRKRGLQAADWFERLAGARQQVDDELARLERSELARRVLDLGRMRRLAERMPACTMETMADYTDYYRVLQYGLMVGAFLRWFEAGA